MRFYPQSFELSTLGGWIATRAGGHFATRPDARRRPRRGRARDHAERDLGLAPAAGLGRRTLARPDAARLGGDPRRHHRGVGARAAAPVAPGRAHGALRLASWPAPRRCAPSSRPACGPPTAGSSTRWRPQQTGAGDGERARARARLRVHRPRRRARARARARALPRARRRARRAARRGATARRVARGLPAHALPARHARAPRDPHRHLRDRHHVGAPARLPRGRRRRDARGARRALPRDLPPHARLSRRPGALLHGPRAGAPRRRARAVARDEERRLRRDPRRGRHHHPPPRRRARPPAPGTTPSAPSRSPRRCARAKAAVDPKGLLNPGVLLDP